MRLWARREELAAAIARDRVNSRYLPGLSLPDGVAAESDIGRALEGAQAVVLAVPSTGVREVASKLSGKLSPTALLVHAGKGLEAESGLRGSEVICQVLGDDVGRRCVALSGPNLAVELANNIPTATVVASADAGCAVQAQELFASPSFRAYRNSDIAGVELGGALKNVFAIGAGISDGLGYGDNTKATLVTRALVEMTRLGTVLGAVPRTFTGLAGFGDLMATCASRLSRNLRLGLMLGQGSELTESLESLGQVAEGMHTCEAAHMLSIRHGVEAPITQQVYAVLFERKNPRQAVSDLMSREYKEELSL